MQIGIGLPGTIPGVQGELILDWARRAESGPFSSLATLDRLVYPNYEALITLAAVAGDAARAFDDECFNRSAAQPGHAG